MQAAAVFQESAVAGSWQCPAVDWCYNHVEAFRKIRFTTQNIRSLMDCSQLCTFMGVGGRRIPPSSRPSLYSMHEMVWWRVRSLKSHEWIMVRVACVLSRCVCGASTARSFGSQGKKKKEKKKTLRPKSGDEKLAIKLLRKWTAAVWDMWLSGRHMEGVGPCYVMIDKPKHRFNWAHRLETNIRNMHMWTLGFTHARTRFLTSAPKYSCCARSSAASSTSFAA